MIRFSKPEIYKLLSKLKNKEDKIQLVADEGIYLMSFAEDAKLLPSGKTRTIAYAEGCNPEHDLHCFDNKFNLFGGDDAVIELCTAKELAEFCLKTKDYVTVRVTPTRVIMGGSR